MELLLTLNAKYKGHLLQKSYGPEKDTPLLTKIGKEIKIKTKKLNLICEIEKHYIDTTIWWYLCNVILFDSKYNDLDGKIDLVPYVEL